MAQRLIRKESALKTRIKFSKEGNLRFVRHLDMMHYFQKANQRAELPVTYSEDFHLHQIMNFVAPLGTGLGGKAEYFDLRITGEGTAALHNAEATGRLGREMAGGIRILSFLRLPDDSPNCMSIIRTTDCRILLRAVTPEDKIAGQFVDDSVYRSLTGDEERSLRAAVDELLQRKEIPVQKTGKKGNLCELNLRPMIHALRCKDDHLRCTVTQGSEASLKPELPLSALFSPDTARPSTVMPHRVVHTELYNSAGKTLESCGTIF